MTNQTDISVAPVEPPHQGRAAPEASVDHPPRPNLTLRVGVAGHRPKPDKFPPESFARVSKQLREVFLAIDAALAVLGKKYRAFYADKPHKVRLVSGLAEGADQMAVDAMPWQWALDAILPFPRDSYLEDFRASASGDGANVTEGFERALAKATTVVELPEDTRAQRDGLTPKHEKYWKIRNAAYAPLGGFLLRQVDVLVAVWDGKREEGAGGTGDVVRQAVEAGIPTVWISTLERTFPRMVLEFDEDGESVAPPADCTEGALEEAISTIVSISAVTTDLAGQGEAEPSAEERLIAFFAECWPKPSRWLTYDLYKKSIEGKPRRLVIRPETIDEHRRRWSQFIEDAPKAGDLGPRLVEILLPRYAWADALAVDLSHRYRSAYFNCYLMAAMAVAIALVGIFSHAWFAAHASMLAFKALLVAIELGIIFTIVFIVRNGRRARWQERWLEYRALAEMLRDVRFLAYLGEHGRIQRAQNLEPASSAWFLWYLRATIREVGLPGEVLDGGYQRALLNAVEKHVIVDQLRYHIPNASTLARMHHVLQVAGDRCFIWTGIVLTLFFTAWLCFIISMCLHGVSYSALLGIGEHAESVLESFLYGGQGLVTFLAACLPTLGAALAGIRETGDFEGFAKRSAMTADALQTIKRDALEARRRLSLDATGDVLFDTAQVLTEDLAAWQSLYGRKRLNLPA